MKSWAQITAAATRTAGHPTTFGLAVLSVVIWAASGPFFGFSDTWQLYCNTATTVVTFLMMFGLQASQNRDGVAIQAKLDELIAAQVQARNDLIGIEARSSEEIEALRRPRDT
jgi:low affinity Fe/Cu permease